MEIPELFLPNRANVILVKYEIAYYDLQTADVVRSRVVSVRNIELNNFMNFNVVMSALGRFRLDFISAEL